MLNTGELDRIRRELGYHLLNTGAEPYIGVQAAFAQVIQPYLREGLETTSATAITGPGVVSITLGSVVGIAAYSRVALDVDGLFEVATVRSVVGSAISVYATKAHPAGYPVTLDGGLLQVREILAAIDATHQLIAKLRGTGGLKAVDEIEFYDAHGKTQLAILQDQLAHHRRELSIATGYEQQLRPGNNGATVALY